MVTHWLAELDGRRVVVDAPASSANLGAGFDCLGVALGLVVGKTVGVFTAAFVAVKLGLGKLPAGTTWRHILGLAMVAGVGFTVALFVTSISFTDPALAGGLTTHAGDLFSAPVAVAHGYSSRSLAELGAAPAVSLS